MFFCLEMFPFASHCVIMSTTTITDPFFICDMFIFTFLYGSLSFFFGEIFYRSSTFFLLLIVLFICVSIYIIILYCFYFLCVNDAFEL